MPTALFPSLAHRKLQVSFELTQASVGLLCNSKQKNNIPPELISGCKASCNEEYCFSPSPYILLDFSRKFQVSLGKVSSRAQWPTRLLSLSWFLWHEATRSNTTPSWMRSQSIAGLAPSTSPAQLIQSWNTKTHNCQLPFCRRQPTIQGQFKHEVTRSITAPSWMGSQSITRLPHPYAPSLSST